MSVLPGSSPASGRSSAPVCLSPASNPTMLSSASTSAISPPSPIDSLPASSTETSVVPPVAVFSPAAALPALASPSEVCESSVSVILPSLSELHDSLPSLNPEWSDQTTSPSHQIRLCKIAFNATSSTQPLFVSCSLIVDRELTWNVYVYGHRVKKEENVQLKEISSHLDVSSFLNLLSILGSVKLCPGNTQSHFLEMAHSRKGQFMSVTGCTIARLENYPIPTIRRVNCQLVTSESKCTGCKSYEATLRALHSQWVRSKGKSPTKSKFTNNRYLKTPQKIRKLKSLRQKATAAERKVKQLRGKIQRITNKVGVEVDDALHNDLLTTMKDNDSRIEEKYPTGTFRYLFWKEQMKCAMASNARQMRWHPTIIKWCLNLKLLSSAAYHSLRTAGFIKLPSERTLRDYTHYFKSKPGFQVEVEQMLMKEAGLDKSTILGYQKFVTILFDEIKVKESIVYDKHSSHVLGFVELNDLYDELLQLEDSEEGHKPVATHVLAFMVRGIFTDLKFPFAHFPTKDISGDQLFSLIWDAIERIERLGLKVVALTGDGCSPNRKFFRMHATSKELCYKTKNIYAPEKRFIYFFSDVPHLMKTARNCWSHSSKKGTRHLWVWLC